MTRLLYLGGLTSVGLAVWWMAAQQWVTAAARKEEVFKVGLQVLVFGLAGGGVKLLLDLRKERQLFRAAVLERLGEAHKGVYRIRRLLTGPLSDFDRYRLLGELMDVRQDLGNIYHVVRARGLGRKAVIIQGHTEAMRSYLEEVIDAAFAGTDGERLAFDEFLRWRECEGPYHLRFKQPYFEAKKEVDASFSPSEERLSLPP